MKSHSFEWDDAKDLQNQKKHHISFAYAQLAFYDPFRIIVEDIEHSWQEPRYFCVGKVDENILTVRFTMRNKKIRIFGAGFWRDGRKRYEQKNNIHE